MTPRDLSGTILGGRYRVGALLGAGGMGAVYEATQMDLGRRVAIKVIYDELAWRPDIVTRFHREAQAAAALGHPNIVQVTDFSPGPPPFLVMELLEGASLQKTVARGGPLSPPRVVFIATQLLSALAAAHRAGLIHRDIKPDNIFLTANAAASDLVKVVDFGVVKQIGDPAAHQITATGEMVGSPAFMAPEQLRGRDVDARTDIYAAGVCMYFALTGRLPFHAGSLPQLLFAIDEQAPQALSTVRPDLDPQLAFVVERAMAKRPEHRFQSAEEMLAALPRASGLPFAMAPTAAAPIPPVARPAFTPASPPKTNTAGWVIALVIGGTVLGVVLLVARGVERHMRPPDAPTAIADASGGPDASVDGSPAAVAVISASPTATPAPPHVPPGHKEVDSGSHPDAPAPTHGGTIASAYEGGPYAPGQINAALTPHIGAIAACADRTPLSDFRFGTEVMVLDDIFVVTVGPHGDVVGSIGHPTDSYSRTLDACVGPILRAAAWGTPASAGTFKVNVASRRKTPKDGGR
jgi:serine/threonine-protein kinase